MKFKRKSRSWLLLLSLFLTLTNSYAQSTYFDNLFDQVYNFPNAGNTVLNVNGKYIVGGNGSIYDISCFNSSIDFFTIDLNGNLESSKSYNYTVDNTQNSQLVISSDSMYVFATTKQTCIVPSSAMISLLKLNKVGDSLWGKDVILGIANDIQLSGNSNFVVAGSNFYNDGVNPIVSDFLLIETDSAGNILWDTAYGSSTGIESAVSVTVTNSGFMVFGTVRDSVNGNSNIYMINTDLNGILQWDKRIMNTKEIVIYGSLSTNDGNYLLYGLEFTSATNQRQGYFIKLDTLGNTIWERSYGEAAFESIYNAKELNNGDFIAVGAAWSQPTTSSGLLIKLRTNGDSLWARNFITQDSVINRFNNIQLTSDNGFVIAGESNDDMWLMKVDSLGCEIQNCLTAIQDNDQGFPFNMRVYPNPGNGQVTFASLPQNQDVLVAVYDVLGKLVFNQHISKHGVDFSHLCKGTYLLRITVNASTHGMKFVKL